MKCCKNSWKHTVILNMRMLLHLYSLMHLLRTSWHIMAITLLGIIGPWNKVWTEESTKCPDRFVCSNWKCYVLWFTSASNINVGDFSVFHFKLYLNHLCCPENFFFFVNAMQKGDWASLVFKSQNWTWADISEDVRLTQNSAPAGRNNID